MEIVCNVARGVGKDKVVLAKDLKQVLDFSNCTPEEMAELASKTVLISLQRIWRELDKETLAQEDGKTLDVHEFINRPTQRTAPDPVKQVLKKEMTAEELQDLIAKLQAKVKK